AVVTTRGREHLLEATLDSLNNPIVHVVADAASGLTPNHLAAWQHLHLQGRSHCLLLQDDILAARGWLKAAAAFIDRFPNSPVSLYTARKAAITPTAQAKGYAHLPTRQWLNEQALVLPAPVVGKYLDWVRAKHYRDVITPAQILHHDVLLRAFRLTTQPTRSLLLSAPSVVQHIGKESTVGNPWLVGGKARQAQGWPGEHWDAGDHFAKVLNSATEGPS